MDSVKPLYASKKSKDTINYKINIKEKEVNPRPRSDSNPKKSKKPRTYM